MFVLIPVKFLCQNKIEHREKGVSLTLFEGRYATGPD